VTSKVDEILAKIPVLKASFSDIMDFKGQCVDPLAIEIIGASLDYALETSVRRIESVAKINPAIRGGTETILRRIKTLRTVIQDAPACATSILGTAPVKTAPKPRKVKEPEPEATEVKTPEATPTPEVKVPEPLQKIEKAIKKAKTAKPPPVETVQLGKQFTLDLGKGDIRKFMIVDPKVVKAKEQRPEETGVYKVSPEFPVSVKSMGKKVGDTVKLEFEGLEAEGKITEVKEGHMKPVKEI
jgi:hypothetical protein